MANMLPEAFRKELQTLQDRVPPRPYEDIEARLVAELGRSRAEPGICPNLIGRRWLLRRLPGARGALAFG